MYTVSQSVHVDDIDFSSLAGIGVFTAKPEDDFMEVRDFMKLINTKTLVDERHGTHGSHADPVTALVVDLHDFANYLSRLVEDARHSDLYDTEQTLAREQHLQHLRDEYFTALRGEANLPVKDVLEQYSQLAASPVEPHSQSRYIESETNALLDDFNPALHTRLLKQCVKLTPDTVVVDWGVCDRLTHAGYPVAYDKLSQRLAIGMGARLGKLIYNFNPKH